MAAKLEEVAVVYLREKVRRDKWTVSEVKLSECEKANGHPRTFSIVGDSEPGEFDSGMTYRVYGNWDKANKFGQQFRYKTFVRAQPHGMHGVIKYLQQCPHVGLVIAQKLWDKFQGDAVRILREDPEVAAAAGGSHFSVERATEASKHLVEWKALEDITIQLTDLLDGRGFPKGMIRESIRRWGHQAVEMLRRNPYLAMSFRGVGFKKADAFYLDLGNPPARLKRQAYSITYEVVRSSDSQGHTWVKLSQAVDQLKASIGGADCTPEKAITLARRGGILELRQDDDGEWWAADKRRAEAERYVCRKVVDAFYHSQIGSVVDDWESRSFVTQRNPDFTRCTACHRKLTAEFVAILDSQPYGPECVKKIDFANAAEKIPLNEWLNGITVSGVHTEWSPGGESRLVSRFEWPDLDRHEFRSLSEHQLEQLGNALAGPIGILGGTPGSGKTYTIARLIDAIISIHGSDSVAVMAPTGKAAVRCGESLADNKITQLSPKTIHRTLGVESSDDGWTFKYREGNPLPFRFLIIDEFSMVDVPLFRSVLAARNRGTGILLVGDVEQLPPVGYGAPLRDMIAAGLPHGELTEIHRNAGTIVRACKSIREGKPFEVDDTVDLGATPAKNLILLPASKSTAQIKVLSMLRKIRDESPFDAVWDTMTCVAVNQRSPLSRKTLNPLIQGELNLAAQKVNGTPFRVGDKLIQLENRFLQIDGTTGNDNKVLCCNGEFAKSIEVHANKTIVEFYSPSRKVLIPKGKSDGKKSKGKNGDGDDEQSGDDDTGCSLDLGFAITVHKAQGSGCPVVIVCLDEYPGASGRFGVCDRSWLYTAISRAEKLCILVGTMDTANRICSRRFIWNRKTFMREILAEYAKQAGIAFPNSTPELIVDDEPASTDFIAPALVDIW